MESKLRLTTSRVLSPPSLSFQSRMLNEGAFLFSVSLEGVLLSPAETFVEVCGSFGEPVAVIAARPRHTIAAITPSAPITAIATIQPLLFLRGGLPPFCGCCGT